MKDPSGEGEKIIIQKRNAVNEYLRIVVEELNHLEKYYNMTYITDFEPYHNDYKMLIRIGKSKSELIKSKDTAVTLTAYFTEEITGFWLWRKKRSRMHLKIQPEISRLPGLTMETIRALFRLYTYKIIEELRNAGMKDLDHRVYLEFI